MNSPIAATRRFSRATLCMFFACALTSLHVSAQSAQPVVTLDPPTGWEYQVHALDAQANALPEAPANFRRLGEARVGETADLHTLTMRFAATAKITDIKSSREFTIEQGGSCVAGNVYEAKSTCTLLVRFAPQGAGNRLGHLFLSTNLSPTPDAFGLGGYGYSPILSFVPSFITTVPGTYPSNTGLLNGAQNLVIDGSDTLWVADTGNNVVRNMDSSGNFKTLASGFAAPRGIAVDTFGQAYFDLPATNLMYEIYDYGPVVQVNGAGTSGCPASAPCTFSSEAIGNPGTMSMDPYNHLFFADNHQGAAMATVQPTPANLIFLYDPFPYQTSPSSPIAVDSSDNIYSLWSNGGECEIVQQSLYNAENSNVAFTKIAGGHTCGFAGDGGLAGNAEIGAKIGQIAFDAAGNMYFSDTDNQRVRRIDYVTGTIRTIAGNGTAGYAFDGYPATSGELANPTGVGVDSQGQVYIISGAAATGTAQVIRKLTSRGLVNFPSQPKGTSSAAYIMLVSNTGNSVMTLTSTQLTGNNPSDFVVDPKTTSCLLTAGATLQSGASCQIGFIFTPSATGARSASLYLLDNTVNNSNSIYLYGTGSLPPANFKITSPTNGASFTSGTAVTFSASVTSSSGTAPTGTVQFKVDGANYGGPVTITSGAASTTVTGLTTASHTLSATYSGDSNYASGGPISVTITVTSAAPAKNQTFVSLTPVIRRAAACSSGSFQVSVTSAAGPAPAGEVQLLDGGTMIASSQLVNGTTMVNTPPLDSGSHNLVAAYLGDDLHYASVSETVVRSVSATRRCGPMIVHDPVRLRSRVPE